jgi:hypothetical protein
MRGAELGKEKCDELGTRLWEHRVLCVLPTFQGQHETRKLSFAGGGSNLPTNNYIIAVLTRIYRLFVN